MDGATSVAESDASEDADDEGVGERGGADGTNGTDGRGGERGGADGTNGAAIDAADDAGKTRGRRGGVALIRWGR